MARFVNFTLDFTEIPMKMILVSKGGGSSEVEVGWGSLELNETPPEPRQECHTNNTVREYTIKRTVSDCQTEVLSGTVKLKLMPGSTTIKNTASECHD